MRARTLAVLVLTVAAMAGFSLAWYAARGRGAGPWNQNLLTASYVGAELHQVDRSNATLLLNYEVQNNSDTDYRLSDGPGFQVMSRLGSDNSLSSQQDVKLSYATFLPARQRARVALELARPFNWPADGDPAMQDKLRDFVNQRLADVDEFVLFDQGDRAQIAFPKGWQQLQLASAATK